MGAVSSRVRKRRSPVPATIVKAPPSLGLLPNTYSDPNPDFRSPALENSMQIDLASVDIADSDAMSHATFDAVLHVVACLTIADLGRLQRVSRAWYEIIRSNAVWLQCARIYAIPECYAPPGFVLDVAGVGAPGVAFGGGLRSMLEATTDPLRDGTKWKRVVRDAWRPRKCDTCKQLFRECFAKDLCKVHPQGRDLVDYNRGFGSSGVRYLCCGALARDAPGCSKGTHGPVLYPLGLKISADSASDSEVKDDELGAALTSTIEGGRNSLSDDAQSNNSSRQLLHSLSSSLSSTSVSGSWSVSESDDDE